MIRLPAGVRSSNGKALGGRFATPERVVELAEHADDVTRERLLNALEEAGDRASDNAERALAELQRLEDLFNDDPKRYARRRAAAENRYGAAAEKSNRILDATLDVVEQITPDLEPLDEAEEWEIGFEYEATNGRQHDVDVNIRVRRVDRRPMDRNEALRVMTEFRQTMEIPVGYLMAGIAWQRPHKAKGWTHARHDLHDALRDFLSPMYTESDNDSLWSLTRLGSVKQ